MIRCYAGCRPIEAYRRLAKAADELAEALGLLGECVLFVPALLLVVHVLAVVAEELLHPTDRTLDRLQLFLLVFIEAFAAAYDRGKSCHACRVATLELSMLASMLPRAFERPPRRAEGVF